MTIEKPSTGFRWTICALVFAAVSINYLDRQLMAAMVPFFENDLRLGPTDLALINVSFIVPYGLAMIFVGRFIDRVGLRRGLATSFFLWSLASMAHALVRGLGSFMSFRFILGLGESGMYPSAIKTATDWFPVKDRALATGIFNAGANLGAVFALLAGVWIAVHFGWRTCFLVTGGAGLIWLLFWRLIYVPPTDKSKVSDSELAYIRADDPPDESPFNYRDMFAMRPVYGLGIAKALTDAPWWFYLFWLPKFLVDQMHVSTTFMAVATAVVYIVADVGSVAGGWLSSAMIHRGRPVGSARKLTMLVCAVAVVPVIAVGPLVDIPSVAGIPSVYWVLTVISIMAGAHQGWSSNLFTLISDTTPAKGMAMTVGAINGFAMIGVAGMQLFVGRTVQLTSSYTLVFLASGLLYLVALGVIQLFMPRVERATPKRPARMSLVAAGAVVMLTALAACLYAANKPPYTSLGDYLAKRPSEIHATLPAQEGPAAKVGWMEAHWFLWPAADGKPKLELLKFDTHGRPIVEAKGASAPHYLGPPKSKVATDFHVPP